MTTYRNFIIEPVWNYNDGKFDGIYYQQDDEHARGIYRQTLSEVKDAIDEYYFEKTSYKVLNPNSKTITKFDYWEEAVAFCRSCCIPVDFIKLEIAGFNVDFDSV